MLPCVNCKTIYVGMVVMAFIQKIQRLDFVWLYEWPSALLYGLNLQIYIWESISYAYTK